MTVKATWLFDYRTVPTAGGRVQTGGWSESWYTSLLIGGATINQKATDWAVARAGLLPLSTSIIGYRLQEVGSGNKAQVFNLGIGGAQGFATDVPSMSIRYTANSSESQNERFVVLRGMPDPWVAGGALAWNAFLQNALNQFNQRLTVDQWRFRGRNLTFTQYPLLTIGSTGMFVALEDLPFESGDAVQVLRSKQAITNRLRGGIYKIAAMTDARNGTLAQWQWGSCDGGSIRSNGYVYPIARFNGPMTAGTVQVSSKKAGRSFFQYRGRRSKR